MTGQTPADAGRSPLPANIAHASLIVLRRMAQAAKSIPYSPPTPTEQATWAELLSRKFAALPIGTQRWIERAPALAEVWEWQWEGLAPAEQNRMRHVWARQLKDFDPELAREAAAAPAAIRELPPRPSAQGNPIASALSSLNDTDQKQREDAASISPRGLFRTGRIGRKNRG